jgi:hypothetical protein
VHDTKDSNLLFILAFSPLISLASFASITLVPIGRLHSFLKNFASPASKKTSPEMRAAFNFLRSSPLSRFGCLCWIHSSRSSLSHFVISSIVGFVWLAWLGIYVLERSPWRLIGRRNVGVTSEVARRDGEKKRAPAGVGSKRRSGGRGQASGKRRRNGIVGEEEW